VTPRDRVSGRRVARTYAPLAAVAVAFLVMAVTVKPIGRTRQTAAVDVSTPNNVTDITAPTDAGAGGGSFVGGSAGSAGRAGRAVTRACPDRSVQVPGDPYSPACSTFTGDNGGATFRGVTRDSITITVRQLEGPTAAELFADLSGERVNDSKESVVDTVQALAEYFSSRFNFYGRKIKIQFFDGEGNGSSELLGAGQDKALADAVKAAQQYGAFADISGITIPYADALAKQGVVNIGSPYPSREWFVSRRPYSWSLFPDGTNVVISAASWITSRLAGQTTAQYAGPDYQGKPRKYAVVAPENAEYQESVNRYISLLGAAGIPVALNLKYKLDISSMPNQASNLVAQMKNAGITSVICGCDPVMLALGLTPKSNEQDYTPEWLTSGLAFVDQDIVSQLIDPKQWQRAFGIAYNAESEREGGSFPYAAYKAMRPNDEPAFGVEEIYYQMYMLAIGLQLAGPKLTPQTFEQGMFAYQGGHGPRGYWHFGPGDYTPTDDFREIWWDPNRVSPQDDKPGAWVQLNGGRRYFPGQVPHEPAPYFQGG